MKRNIPFHFLHRLVDMSVQDGNRSEAFQIAESLRTVFRAPTPFGVNAPKRDVCVDNDGSACGKGFSASLASLMSWI